MRDIDFVVSSKYAAFNMPATPTDRCTYEVITPSVCGGVMRAIHGKPEFVWRIKSITVMNPIRIQSVVMNGINCFGAKNIDYIQCDSPTVRQQTQLQVLCDVQYRITAAPQFLNYPKDFNFSAAFMKHTGIFRDRVVANQYARGIKSYPHLGMKRFECKWRLATDEDVATSELQGTTKEIKALFFDYNRNTGEPVYFDAVMENGTINISKELYQTKIWR